MTFGRMRLTQRKKKHDFIPLCLWIIYVFSSEQLTAGGSRKLTSLEVISYSLGKPCARELGG